MVEWGGNDNREYGIENREEIMEFRFYVFTNLSTNPTHSVGTPRAFASRHHIFRCTFFRTSLRNLRPPVAISFFA